MATKKTSSKSLAARQKNGAPKVGTVRMGAAGRYYNRWDGKKWVRVTSAKPAANPGSSTSKSGSAKPASSRPANKSTTPSHYTGSSVNKPGGGSPPRGKTGQVYKDGRWVAGNSSAAKSSSGPKEGDRKNFMTGPAVYKNGKWVKVK